MLGGVPYTVRDLGDVFTLKISGEVRLVDLVSPHMPHNMVWRRRVNRDSTSPLKLQGIVCGI